MADSGSTDVADIASMIEEFKVVDVRLAIVKIDDGWQVRHGWITLDAAAAPESRTWRYAGEIFLDRRLSGPVTAGLLRGELQDVDELKVTAPPPANSGLFQRVAGSVDWRPASMPWPRIQWEVTPAQSVSSRQGGLLVGAGPSFVSYEAAFSAFFFAAEPSNMASQEPLWRVIRLDRRAWLHRVAVSADAIMLAVKGNDLDGVSLELSTPTASTVRRVGRTGRLKVRLPHGLAAGTLLVLRRGDEWLDFRHFASSGPSGRPDPSVVWVRPEAEVALMVAGGEGQYVEFKEKVPTTEGSKKTVLKTIAAFASEEGGTVLFGVNDDAQVVGVEPGPAGMDGLKLAISNMIRDSITPVPTYTLHVTQLDGKTLLLVEVPPGQGWYTLNPAKPEFYVRRGASTPPARLDEITARFAQPQLPYGSF